MPNPPELESIVKFEGTEFQVAAHVPAGRGGPGDGITAVILNQPEEQEATTPQVAEWDWKNLTLVSGPPEKKEK